MEWIQEPAEDGRRVSTVYDGEEIIYVSVIYNNGTRIEDEEIEEREETKEG